MKTNVIVQNNEDLLKLKEALAFQNYQTEGIEPRLEQEDMIYVLDHETQVATVYPVREVLENSEIEIMSVNKYMNQDQAYQLGKETSIQVNCTLLSPTIDDMDEYGHGIVSSSNYQVVMKEGDCLLLKPNGEIASIAISVKNDPDCSYKVITEQMNISEYHTNYNTDLQYLINDGSLIQVDESVFHQVMQEQDEELERQWAEIEKTEYINMMYDVSSDVPKEAAMKELLSYQNFFEFKQAVYCENIPNICISFVDEPTLYVLETNDQGLNISEYEFHTQEDRQALSRLKEFHPDIDTVEEMKSFLPDREELVMLYNTIPQSLKEIPEVRQSIFQKLYHIANLQADTTPLRAEVYVDLLESINPEGNEGFNQEGLEYLNNQCNDLVEQVDFKIDFNDHWQDAKTSLHQEIGEQMKNHFLPRTRITLMNGSKLLMDHTYTADEVRSLYYQATLERTNLLSKLMDQEGINLEEQEMIEPEPITIS